MTLQVVGAGIGRTGTESLKLALERLLGGKCHHMAEVLAHPESSAYWVAAGQGDMPDWNEVFDGYTASVDWPSAGYWPEISAAFPAALVLLSTRADADTWYRSAADTIFRSEVSKMPVPGAQEFFAGFLGRFGADPSDPESAKAAYERHNAAVRQAIPKDRLLEWSPGDGWEPICSALGLSVPDEPFPHVNTTAMFSARLAAMGKG